MTRRPSHVGVDARPERRDHTAPLVPEAHRVVGVSLVQVGHLAGPELHVGAAHTDSVDVDDDLALAGDRIGNVLRPRLRAAP